MADLMLEVKIVCRMFCKSLVTASYKIMSVLFSLLMHENCHRKFPKGGLSSNI